MRANRRRPHGGRGGARRRAPVLGHRRESSDASRSARPVGQTSPAASQRRQARRDGTVLGVALPAPSSARPRGCLLAAGRAAETRAPEDGAGDPSGDRVRSRAGRAAVRETASCGDVRFPRAAPRTSCPDSPHRAVGGDAPWCPDPDSRHGQRGIGQRRGGDPGTAPDDSGARRQHPDGLAGGVRPAGATRGFDHVTEEERGDPDRAGEAEGPTVPRRVDATGRGARGEAGQCPQHPECAAAGDGESRRCSRRRPAGRSSPATPGSRRVPRRARAAPRPSGPCPR